jgi:carbon storage regulator CsrA
MLVLSRKIGQQLIMTDGKGLEITITALRQSRSGMVTIGIDAPLSIAVYREEAHERRERSRDIVANTGDDAAPPEEPSASIGGTDVE